MAADIVKCMNSKKALSVLLFFAVISIFLSISVNAGVGFRTEVQIYPGQTLTEALSLQNLNKNDPDLKFTGSIVEGGEFVSFAKGNEFVVLGGEAVEAPIKIKLPRDAEAGDRFKAKIKFSSLPLEDVKVELEGDTAVHFTKGFSVGFEVVVVEKPPQESPPITKNMWLIIIWAIAAVLIFFVVLFWRRYRRKETDLFIENQG